MAPTKRFDTVDPEISARILDAARAEFLAHGYDSASLNRILEKADLSKGSFYYYFEDKADLYFTVVSQAMDEIAAMGMPMPDLSGDFWTGVYDLNRRLLALVVDKPEHMRLMSGLRDLSAAARKSPRLAGLYDSTVQMSRMLIEAGIARGEVRDDLPIELLTAALMAIGEAMDLWHLVHFEKLALADIDPLVLRYTEMFWRMMAPAAKLSAGFPIPYPKEQGGKA